MGAGIAQIACLGGFETRLHDPVAEALPAGEQRLRTGLEKGVERGRWSGEEAERATERLRVASRVEDLAGCELVIEAAPEELGLKQKLFTQLAEVCGPEAVLATNTSSLSVTAIAAGVPEPQRVVGMHFFNPPALMELVEVVAGTESSEEALQLVADVGERIGRTPVRAADEIGFVANRCARPFSLEALRLLGDRIADAETIDRICRVGGGFRMGPFELIDLIGLDVNLSVARSFYAQGGEPERWLPNPIQERLVAEGRLGRKSGRGFYEYGEGSGREPDPELGIAAPTLDPTELAKIDPAAPEILPRLIAQIANEAAFALEEEVGTPADMDTAMRLGFNWPLGPLELTELIGGERARRLLVELRAEHGEAYRPAPLLASVSAGS